MELVRRNWFYLVVLVGLLFLPLVSESSFVEVVMPSGLTGSALLHVFILMFFFAFMSQAWNIIGGFGGQLSIGHAAFFGIGAYVSTICYIHFGLSPWVGMFVAAIFTAVIGAGLGLFSFHYGTHTVIYMRSYTFSLTHTHTHTFSSKVNQDDILLRWRLWFGDTPSC